MLFFQIKIKTPNSTVARVATFLTCTSVLVYERKRGGAGMKWMTYSRRTTWDHWGSLNRDHATYGDASSFYSQFSIDPKKCWSKTMFFLSLLRNLMCMDCCLLMRGLASWLRKKKNYQSQKGINKVFFLYRYVIACECAHKHLHTYTANTSEKCDRAKQATEWRRRLLDVIHHQSPLDALRYHTPMRAAHRSALIQAGSSLLASCLTHLFSHLSFFFPFLQRLCTLLSPLQWEWMQAKYDCLASPAFL